MVQPEEVTLCLRQIEQGDESAADRLFPHVYEDLRRMAGRIFSERLGQNTLQPTALVHEAYMRLAKPQEQGYENRRHFMYVAAKAMRRLLTDHVRGRETQKRGGAHNLIALDADAVEPAAEEPQVDGVDLIALDDALTKLRDLRPRQADIVELRFLAGMTVEEVSGILGITDRAVYKDWSMARAWLQRELGSGAA